jgi:glycosyltransferase involved in cell wall biosynthesis
MLYLYGTVYNNANRIQGCLESIKNLDYKRLFVVDNYSTDGTYEFLEKNKERYKIELMRLKCNRGIGRQISMESAIKVSTMDDYLMTIDFDTIYFQYFINFINEIIKEKYKNCVFNSYLCLRDANSIPWKPVNNGEDWERNANFIYHGYTLFDKKIVGINEEVIGSRDKRYAKGLKLYYRLFKNAIELQRTWCFKSFKENYEFANKQSKLNERRKLILFLTYIIAKMEANYCYDKSLNNNAYVKKNRIIVNNKKDIDSYLKIKVNKIEVEK